MRSLESERVHHGRVALALHILKRESDGPPLLLLHALHGSSADWADEVCTWPGGVYALDFSGHGDSDWLPGRGYAPEVFVAEADMAIARIASGDRPLCIAGAGVGAYVAVLLAGARADVTAGVLLLPGAGLVGGGATPDQMDEAGASEWRTAVATPPRREGEPSPDPMVNRCERDVRPLYYIEEFARAAPPLHIAPMPVMPPWLQAALEHGDTRPVPAELGDALRQLAGRQSNTPEPNEPPGASG